MTVSIIIPIYNGEHYISSCFSSLMAQTYTNWNVVVVNDGSIDNTLSVLLSWAQKDIRIIVIDQENKGAAAARAKGIEVAKGDYITFVDIDDTLTPDCLEKLVNAFEGDVDIVAGAFCIIGKRRNIKRRLSPATLGNVDYLKKIFKGKYGLELCAKMYRRKLFYEPLSIPSYIRNGEDAAVYIQLVTRSGKVKIINEAIYNYIQHLSSASHQKSVKHAEETLLAAFYIDEFLKRESFYPSIKNEIDAMYLLFYSNSTRKTFLSIKHPLISQIYQEHFSLKAVKMLPFLKSIYVSLSLLVRKIKP